jgi:hypothetical protein
MREEFPNTFADEILGTHADHLCALFAAIGVAPILVQDQHAICDAVQHVLQFVVRLSQFLLCVLAYGNVHDGTEHTGWLTHRVQGAAAANPDPADRFIRPLNLRFEIPSSANFCTLKFLFNLSAVLG